MAEKILKVRGLCEEIPGETECLKVKSDSKQR